MVMEIKIGMKSVARELSLDIDKSFEELQKLLTDAVAAGEIIDLVDKRESHTLINAGNIAYVEFAPERQNRIGFAI
ncbi:hypothetical protein HMPREF0574_1568 [Mobiluncus curtisii subsp. curtisii ATCC 35241]|nr:hypothetical protein HMPREF0574_1568 [Mobiluncus curtisii subsp. curtisii ATCC 35241]MCU9987023.1 DUF3107 domain-containing protein [Mobiluncus curtisii]MCU9999923.1 DUF3107 domain-containing protein [Mobiluncus curtisii]NMW44337.1 DUF3107 domain-containing protein [Mobiluncus curtisii]NMW44852.1 DUF3107 domain-containing protein [Mobiluncus curtisii]